MINTIEITIWDRPFSLPVKYDCYKGEIITRRQIKAVKDFTKHSEWLANAKEQVEEYCRESVLEDDENQKKSNIYSYIKPEAIFVKHDESHPRVALMCDYRYDVEHGLAIVFSSKGEITVGTQDMIL